jgi:hypothetical protein
MYNDNQEDIMVNPVFGLEKQRSNAMPTAPEGI